VCHVSLPSTYRSRRGHIHLLRVLPLVGCRSKTPTKGFIENLKKNQVSGVGRTVRALGADGPLVFDIYLISKAFGKRFREKYASRRTIRGPYADSPLFSSKPNRTVCSSVDRANGPQPARGQSAGPKRTVHEVLADSPFGPTATSDRR
jgi:hypothetical protein